VNQLKNLLFDLDGTLVHTLPGIEESFLIAIKRVLPDAAAGQLQMRIGPPLREMFRLALGEISVGQLDELVSQFRSHYDSQGWEKTVECSGASGVLKTLREKGMRCFVVTNKIAFPTSRILTSLGLESYFEDIVCLDSRTPNFQSKTEIATFVIDKHCLSKEGTVLVGDSRDDATAAQVCGVKFILAKYGYGWPMDLSDISVHQTINSLQEIASYSDQQS